MKIDQTIWTPLPRNDSKRYLNWRLTNLLEYIILDNFNYCKTPTTPEPISPGKTYNNRIKNLFIEVGCEAIYKRH